jgi:hypothetical protein
MATKLPQILIEVRQWSESQKELWRQIPNLALEADGKNGYSDDLAYCYNYGFWRIWDHSSYRGMFLLCSVDCSTGRIGNDSASFHHQKFVEATDEAVLRLLSRLDDIDAKLLVKKLKMATKVEQNDYIAKSNPNWEKHKAELRTRIGLSYNTPYIRPPWPNLEERHPLPTKGNNDQQTL